MKLLKFSIITIAISIYILGYLGLKANQSSEFDEAAIRSIQETRLPSQDFTSTVQAFEATTDPSIKAAKWEEMVVRSANEIFSATWPSPLGGWKLLDFPVSENLKLQEVIDQPLQKAYYTKLVAQNNAEAVQLRGAGALLLTAASDGEQWGAKLVLDIAQRPDSNLKRLTYWSVKNLGQDASTISWQVDWSAWQQAYNAANNLGKAIILKNITTLAVRKNELTVASAINLSALTGTDRELKAIALAFGHPSLGSSIISKWSEMALNNSDLQIQSLAKEVRNKFGLDN